MSFVTSDISTKSKSRILFTSFTGSNAVELKGPTVWRLAGLTAIESSPGSGGAGATVLVDEAAAARRSNPLRTVEFGVNVGSCGSAVGGGSELSGWSPAGVGTDECSNPCEVTYACSNPCVVTVLATIGYA